MVSLSERSKEYEQVQSINPPRALEVMLAM